MLREVKTCLREAKEGYSRKLEAKLRDNNMREVWNGMKTITGCGSKANRCCVDPQKLEELNTLFNRFSSPLTTNSPPQPSLGFSVFCLSLTLTGAHPSPNLHHSRMVLQRLYPRKAAGPDQVYLRLLRACASELGDPVVKQVFNLSLELGRVPSLWKTSCIVPVPKKGQPRELEQL